MKKKLLFGDTDLSVARDFGSKNIGSSLKATSVPSGPIVIAIAIVDVPDVTNDAHWTQMTSGAIAWQLDSDNLLLVVDGDLGVVRFTRPDTDVNVEFSSKGR